VQEVRRAPHPEAATVQDVGVQHGGLDVRVPQKLLHGADVGAALEQVGGEAVANSLGDINHISVRSVCSNQRRRCCSAASNAMIAAMPAFSMKNGWAARFLAVTNFVRARSSSSSDMSTASMMARQMAGVPSRTKSNGNGGTRSLRASANGSPAATARGAQSGKFTWHSIWPTAVGEPGLCGAACYLARGRPIGAGVDRRLKPAAVVLSPEDN
jgi:hypothetical protein